MEQGTHRIYVEHVTRVEAHGSIRIDTKAGKINEVKLEIVEANRFFESFVQRLQPHEVPHVVSRICGICCVGHQLAAIKAVEAALGIAPSEQTILLRKLLNQSQFLQSHALHLYFLAIPDFVGAKSVIPLAATQPELVQRALGFKKLANDFTAVVGGRTLHPMACTLKGFRKLPDRGALTEIRQRLDDSLSDLDAMVNFITTLKVPRLERETEYVSLRTAEEYALYDGDVYSSTGNSVPVTRYREVCNEFTVAHSTSKWSRWHGDAYMVGALARVNNNFTQLHPQAQRVAKALELNVPCFNPYMNNLAQMVEMVHCTHNSIAMLDNIVGQGMIQQDIAYRKLGGSGAGAVEVPRGVLFHHYDFDDQGLCCGADAVIPTSQNINNIERDMHAFVPQLLQRKASEEELTLHMEMLLRAYDPCISCSVHMLDVEFV